jgi:hypothetical protein
MLPLDLLLQMFPLYAIKVMWQYKQDWEKKNVYIGNYARKDIVQIMIDRKR